MTTHLDNNSLSKNVRVLSFLSETPCQLHCKPKNRYFSVMLKDMVIDGTPCRPGRRDMCISGKCVVSTKNLGKTVKISNLYACVSFHTALNSTWNHEATIIIAESRVWLANQLQGWGGPVRSLPWWTVPPAKLSRTNSWNGREEVYWHPKLRYNNFLWKHVQLLYKEIDDQFLKAILH